MYQILQFLSYYVKPLMAGTISFLGLFLIKRNNTLKVENELINQQLINAEKANHIQNKMAKASSNIEPLDYNAILERMRKGDL